MHAGFRTHGRQVLPTLLRHSTPSGAACLFYLPSTQRTLAASGMKPTPQYAITLRRGGCNEQQDVRIQPQHAQGSTACACQPMRMPASSCHVG